jgi:Protein of unknown function (DUF3617)
MARPSLLRRCGVRREAVRAALAGTAVAALGAVAAVGTLGLLAVTHAAGLGLKPGLWDVRLVRQVVDGHDVSAQLTESIAKVQTALANLPPDARARVQAILQQAGVHADSNASFRICISPAMAANDAPIMDKNGSCRPAVLSRSGNHTTFRIDCTANGTHMQGQGEAISTGDTITSNSDITTRAADGSTHTLHNETQMQYVGADCGTLHAPR